ncbi:RagB/SusD family nutrient uptake outer membrane protein [Draconibacterium halophilum]|uniref:RagB/SusD family nutrient uptake outer membrane protein n=1 Tax=Draconibacterium halophilum TaxID=2706887 RepID=A0A6C0RCG0_9BACT|nr:RagB/SusD family nutrient uptake outer membrane protein [Draconibacterium halophilum]QIA07435.1 RagB/SusD family nutrient uptake outer membrane protein [Draconibacterium halophilum]
MKKIKYLILFFSLTVAFISCDTLDEEIVSGVTSEYLNTIDGLDAGVNASYSFLRTYYAQEEGNKFSVFGTDEYTHGGHGGDWDIDRYGAGLNAENGIMWHVWTNFYQAINTCNAVVDRATASEELTDDEKNPKIAEARFLRAHYYFILVQSYGDVPLTLEETQGVELEAVRTPAAQVYDAIIADLEFAVTHLPVTQSNFGRATQAAAKHMLGLVHITNGNSGTAVPLLKSVIDDYGLALDADPLARYDHDNEQHPEILWSVQYDEDPILTPLGNRSHLHFRPWYEVYASGLVRALGHGYGRPWIRYRPTGWLLNNFRVNGSYDVDSRFNEGFQKVWYYNTTGDALPAGAAVGDTAIYLTGENLTQAQVDAIEARLPGVKSGSNLYSWHPDAKGKEWSWYTTDGTDNNSINIFPTPYKQEDNKRPSVNYAEGSRDLIVYCLSETYLLLAEALINETKASEAVPYINAVRERAAYPGKESEMMITAADATIDFILDERSREFSGEQKRWFDLKRTGKLIERYTMYNPEGQSNNYVQSYHLLRPIPANQLTRVTNEMRQNDGY